MVRLTKIYTKGGDKGATSLVDGSRVPKDHLRLDAYGTIDELNASLGLARAFARGYCDCRPENSERVVGIIERLQQELFDLGADLATPPGEWRNRIPSVTAEQVKALETLLDDCNAELEPLSSFLLPGGGPVSAYLHQARTICRRAERHLVALARSDAVGEHVIPYVNRLSDLLFVLSRWVGRQLAEDEVLWKPGS